MSGPSEAETFAGMGVTPFFIQRLGERQIAVPTEIQRLVIPELAAGRDVLFSSATGTGKTFAYLVPILQRLAENPRSGQGPEVLVCAPTYELCSQIKKESDFLLNGTGIKTGLLIGSANTGRQIETLKKDKPRIVVGNPGRILQLARMGKLKLRGVVCFIMDEADRLVADELCGEVSELAGLLPKERITAACSATIPQKARDRLLPFFTAPPLEKETSRQEIVREYIEHWAFFSEGRKKIDTLRSLLSAVKPRKALVFIDDTSKIGTVVSKLQHHGVAAGGLYGGMDRKDRKQTMDDFRKGSIQVLVTSDLSARGLDIPGITHIIALDVPRTAEAYIHRAGRTARAGKKGIMATIGDELELPRLASLEKKMGIVVFPKVLYKGQVCFPDSPEEERPPENSRHPGSKDGKKRRPPQDSAGKA
ncbi:DEAD/DEAH box helicase [Breznakiella homolactica]|uniref:DEAD/DEAH box helicase n=1 Tax=Breznakiella homolactica TaxID=2798577 RepID=A0A7T8B9H3_9SPIR|nr:DEAD/DEAH box helicase [Breznakiella homolactica]QQO08331.1 DEAD/DEAH box helicase [Breznakiella homolactica]